MYKMKDIVVTTIGDVVSVLSLILAGLVVVNV